MPSIHSRGRAHERRFRHLRFESLEPRLVLSGEGVVGSVWLDLNEDGVRDANESGVGDVAVQLFDTVNGVAGDGDDVQAGPEALTATEGTYQFTDIAPGDYYLQFVLPAGHAFSPQDATVDTEDSDPDPFTGQTTVFNVSMDEVESSWDAGLYVVNPPTAHDDSYMASEHATLAVNAHSGVLANDTDPDGHEVEAVLVSGPQHGTLTLDSDGAFKYKADDGYLGPDSFTYLARDFSQDSNVATVRLTAIDTVNDAPLAHADHHGLSFDGDDFLQSGGNLGQWLGRNSTLEFWIRTTQVGHNTRWLAPGITGVEVNQSVDDIFWGWIDGSGRIGIAAGDSAAAKSIDPINDGEWHHVALVRNAGVGLVQVFVDGVFNSSAFGDTGVKSTPFSSIGRIEGSFSGKGFIGDLDDVRIWNRVRFADEIRVDMDRFLVGDEPTLVGYWRLDEGAGNLTHDDSVSASHATLGGGVDDAVPDWVSSSLLVPAALAGRDFVVSTLRVSDVDAGIHDVEVTISVNHGLLTIAAGVPGGLANGQVSGNGTDTVVLTGTIDEINATLADARGVVYRSHLAFGGSDTLTLAINDLGSTGIGGNLADTDTLLIQVESEPVAANESYATDEDAVLIVNSTNGVLANDSDADGDVLTAELVTGPSNGTLVLNADGSFQYTPDSDFHGTDTFTYLATDGGTSRQVVPADVLFQPGSTTDHGLLGEYYLLPQQAPVRSFPDFDSLTPTHTRVDSEINFRATNGVFAGFEDLVDRFAVRWTGRANIQAAGEVTFYLMSDDGSRLFVDDQLVIANGGEHGMRERSVTLDLSAGFHDLRLEYFENQISAGVILSYAPAEPAIGTVTITVHPINDPPVAVADSYSIDEDTSLVITDAGIAFDTVVETGFNDAIGINSDASPNSPYTLGGTASGAGGSEPGWAIPWVGNAANMTVQSDVVFEGDGALLVTRTNGATRTWSDAQSEPFVVEFYAQFTANSRTVFYLGHDQPADGSFGAGNVGPQILADTDGKIYAMDFGESQPLEFTGVTYQAGEWYKLSFALDVEADTYEFFINDVRYDAPDPLDFRAAQTAINMVSILAEVSGSGTYVDAFRVLAPRSSGVLANDDDPEGSPLTATLVEGPHHGTLDLHSDGTFTYTPDADFWGPDSFTYRASDGELDSPPTTVTLTVHPVDDPPVAAVDSYDVNEDDVLVVDAAGGVLANDNDVDGDLLDAVFVTAPQRGSLTLNADGSFSYTPDADFFGTDSFTYRASDGKLESAETTVTITVHPINDPPVAAPDSYNSNTGSITVSAAEGVLANDTDVENDPFIAVLVSDVSHGTLALNPDGSFSYSFDVGFFEDSFTYLASDGDSSNVATVTLRFDLLPTIQETSVASQSQTQVLQPVSEDSVWEPSLLGELDDVIYLERAESMDSQTWSPSHESTAVSAPLTDDHVDGLAGPSEDLEILDLTIGQIVDELEDGLLTELGVR